MELVAILNEVTVNGGLIELVENQATVYVHVDDGLFFSKPSSSDAALICEDLMEICASHHESIGLNLQTENQSSNLLK